ncbi:uncharacterized protein LOC109202799 isoform X1 [Oreochromis niloticus]|uniref:uncharacterized protein LOC109202799 isoform X1 n=1 Tax=Oreochromis niloticus TaxID=8128 RepID=UPI000DF3EE2A|nr:uncharacterized protein LOC109202799 isoform X1 [Oreochromis niloticus]
MAEAKTKMVVTPKITILQRPKNELENAGRPNPGKSAVAQAQTEMVVTPKITILQRPKNELDEARRPNPGKSSVAQAQTEMVVTPKITILQRPKNELENAGRPNPGKSAVAQAQTEMVVTPKITILQRPKNELENAGRPNPGKSAVAQTQKEMVVKPKKTKKQKEKRVAEEPRRPITRAYARALLEAQNNMADGTNPSNKEMPEIPENTEASSERQNPESLTLSEAKEDMKMKREGNVNNPSGQNPGPNRGTWQHQPNPTFTPHQGRVHFNPWHEIAALRQQLQVSQNYQNDLYWKMVAANKRASYYQFQVNNLHAQMHDNKRHHEETIKDLVEQLEEAFSNKRETEALTNDNEAFVKLDEVMLTLQDQISHPATEQCVESTTQTKEASHTDSIGLKSSKEAEFEVQCRIQQEQIEMLQKQLLAAQNQLKEQAIKHRQEQEARKTEISDLKSQLCSNDSKVETLERELEEAKASSLKIPKEQNEQNSIDANEMQKSEPLKEKGTGGEKKIGKEDSPALSVQESLQRLQEKQKMLTAKVADLETEVKSLPEIPPSKKKKKKRNWLRRLFT